MNIELTDNNAGRGDGSVFRRDEVADLFPIAGKPISELCRAYPNLLIFPQCVENSPDKIGDSTILDIQSTSSPEEVRLCTGNIMGFIGSGTTRLRVKSRFDTSRADNLMHYMLQKVLSINMFDLRHGAGSDEVFDLLMLMFPLMLKTAVRQGIYREYRTFRHSDPKVSGPVDISRFIARNLPFSGNIAYSTRRHSCDNPLTHLVRHTIEYMRAHKQGSAILNIDREISDCVAEIVGSTPQYCPSDRRNVISNNLRLKVHPYYTAYAPLQALCLHILRHEKLSFGYRPDDVYGVLFDGAWLWEEYVGALLRPEGFIHPENKRRCGGIYLFDDRTGLRFPDFYRADIVLDAKYKRLGSYSKVSKVDRDDVHQLIAYMNRLRTARGGFVAPLMQPQSQVPTSRLHGSSSTISIFGIEVCRGATDYKDFCSRMEVNEKVFIASLVGG